MKTKPRPSVSNTPQADIVHTEESVKAVNFKKGGMDMGPYKLFRFIILGSMAFLLGLNLPALGKTSKEAFHHKQAKPVTQQPEKEKASSVLLVAKSRQVNPPTAPQYRPPRRGAPGGRIGGATRGPMQEIPVMYALAPDHLGLTAEAQPTLYWYISKPSEYPLELTIMDENGVNPEIEMPIPSPNHGGIHDITFSAISFKLEKGKSYQWFVSLIIDADRRSKDVIAGGRIEWVDIPSEVTSSPPQTRAEDLTKLYASAGLWYDAVRSISHAIDSNPQNTSLKLIRSSLLEQVGLNELSKLDRHEASIGDLSKIIPTTPATYQG